MSRKIELTREEVYERVWDKPTADLAAELGISDVAVGKLCRRMGVPKPPRGYWARIEAGQKVAKAPLPDPGPGTVRYVTYYPPAEMELPPSTAALLKDEISVDVPSDLHDPSPLVATFARFLTTGEFQDDDLISPPSGEGFLAITASRRQILRALRIMDALAKTLISKGYEIAVAEDYRGETTRALKGGEQVTISLSERTRTIPRQLTEEEKKKPPYLLDNLEVKVPDGRLMINIRSGYDHSQVWRDRKDEPLEMRLGEVVKAIMVLIEAKLETKRREEADRLASQEAARRREEEEKRRTRLESDAASWRKSEDIRAYLRAYESKVIEVKGRLDPESEEAAWLGWAWSYADSIDPLNRMSSKTN